MAEQVSCCFPKKNLMDEDGAFNPLPRVREKYFHAKLIIWYKLSSISLKTLFYKQVIPYLPS